MNNEGYRWVNRTVYNNLTKEVLEDTTESDRILVPDFQGETGRVTISGGVTKSLGNFESARIDVSFSLPCHPTHEELIRTQDELQQLVSAVLDEQLSGLDVVKSVK